MPARSRGGGLGASSSDSNARLTSLEEQTAELLREARASVGKTRTRQSKTRKRRRANASQLAPNVLQTEGESDEVLDKDTNFLEQEYVGPKPSSADAVVMQDIGAEDLSDHTMHSRKLVQTADPNLGQSKLSRRKQKRPEVAHKADSSKDTLPGPLKLSDIIAAETSEGINSEFLHLDKEFWPENVDIDVYAIDSPDKDALHERKYAARQKRIRKKRRRPRSETKLLANEEEPSNEEETSEHNNEAAIDSTDVVEEKEYKEDSSLPRFLDPTAKRVQDLQDHSSFESALTQKADEAVLEANPINEKADILTHVEPQQLTNEKQNRGAVSPDLEPNLRNVTSNTNAETMPQSSETQVTSEANYDIEDDVEQAEEDDEVAHLPALRRPSLIMAKSEEQSLRNLNFTQEAQRVSLKIDDFVPGANVSVAEYSDQIQLVKNVEDEEFRRQEAEAAALERKLEHHRVTLETQAATMMQSCVRGRLGRKRALEVRNQGGLNGANCSGQNRSSISNDPNTIEDVRAIQSRPVESEELDENWTRVHDPDTDDTWYFNISTGESQWDMPAALGKARRAKDELNVRVGHDHMSASQRHNSQMEEPLTRILSPKQNGLTSSSKTIAHPTSPSKEPKDGSGTFGSMKSKQGLSKSGKLNVLESLASTASDSKRHQTKNSSLKKKGNHHEDDDLAYLTQGGLFQVNEEGEDDENKNAAGSDEDGDDFYNVEDSDDEEARRQGPGGQHEDPASHDPDFTKQRNYDEYSEAGSEFSQSTGVWSQSCETPRFFLPDGSTDVKLRETVRHALKQTKFDSVSSLLSSMAKEAKSLQKKAARRAKKGNEDLDLKAVVQCANLSRQEPKMIAGLRIRKSKRVRKQPRDRRKDQRDEDVHVEEEEETPAIYNITYPGMRREDLQGVDEVDEDKITADASERNLESKVRNNAMAAPHKEICFLCWSAGDDMVKRCDEHQQAKQATTAEGSVLTCANWNLAALQRKYRAEEIQELFAKANASLRWDLNRKRFITVIQARHPTYRATFDVLGMFNRRVRSLIKVRKWFDSVLDQLRLGKIKGDRATRKCSILRAKETIMNNRWIRSFKETVILVEPQPPVTSDDITLRGELDTEVGYKVMVRAADGGPSRAFRLIMAPTSAPFALYRPQVLVDIPPPRFVRVPAPSYIFTPDADRELVKYFTTQTSKKPPDEMANQLRGTSVNVFMDMQMEGSWIERLASHAARSATEKAVKEIRDQIPQIVRLRTKHPPPTTIKYANFARKDFDQEGIKRLGGYPPLMAILSQEVTTAVCAQYGKFVVTSKMSIAPIKKKYDEFQDKDGVLDQSLTFKSFVPPETGGMGCSYSPLVSALNTRLPPCIVASAAVHEKLTLEREQEKEDLSESLRLKVFNGELTKRHHDSQWQRYLEGDYVRRLDDHKVRHTNGTNREVQTGEVEDVGFRTTAVAPSQPVESKVETNEFVPSADIAVTNKPGIRGAITTNAGPDYPFCIPSTRELTLLDYFHLLVSPVASSNSTCCFTTLGRQDPGLYMVKAKHDALLGILEMRVYRSFAYFQTPHIEEFRTAEGVPYWFNRKTGETFWESPLIDLNNMKDDDEDRPLIEEPYKATTESERRKFSDTLGGKRKPPSQMRMRQHMLKNYEEGEGEEEDDQEPEFAREIGRAEEKRRALDKRFRDRVGQTSVLKGTAPLLSIEEERAEAKRQRREKRKRQKKRKQQQGGNQVVDVGSGSENDEEKTQPRTRDRGSEAPMPISMGNNDDSHSGEASSNVAALPVGVGPSSPKHATLMAQNRRTSLSLQGIPSETDDDDDDHAQLLTTIQTALQTAMTKQYAANKDFSADDLLKLGMGLGLGIGLGKKQQRQRPGSPSSHLSNGGRTRMLGSFSSKAPSHPNGSDTEEEYDEEAHANFPELNEEGISIAEEDSEITRREEEREGDESDIPLLVATPRHKGPYPSSSKSKVRPTPTPDEQEMQLSEAAKANAVNTKSDKNPDQDSDDSDLSDDDCSDSEDDMDKEFDTHEPAGQGKYWTATGTAVAKSRGQIIHSSMALPEGFVNSVYKPHTAKQHADYLPSLPNLNEATSVGVVKPRNIIKDWKHSGFDPWSDGKDKYTTSFVPSLFVDEKGDDQSGGLFGDHAGLAERRAQAADQQRLAEDLDKLFSWCRHGKYEEIDEYFKDPDCTFPIDSKDALGNTLLSIAAQNGNKRISKLCLRRGADINTQNLNGQTVLHYCMAYGFDALAEYFMNKGADDSLVNADGLTCYEGLSLEDVQNL